MDFTEQIGDYKNKHKKRLNVSSDGDNTSYDNLSDNLDLNVLNIEPHLDSSTNDDDIDFIDPCLNADQRLALEWIRSGKNVLITGQAGTGKSMVIGEVIKWLKHKYGLPTGLSNMREEYAITSMTGISSIGIGGQTLHSWGGIGLAEGSVKDVMKTIERQMKTVHWQTIKVLVIDEISMMSQELFEKLHQIAVILRKGIYRESSTGSNSRLWGGIQLILSGDFLQLPPIGNENKDNGKFCFQSELWNKFMSRLNVIHLTKIYRQGDVRFQNMLSRLRMGIVTPEDREILQSRVVRKMPKIDPNSGNPNDLILPTKLYPYRKDVEGINEEEYQKTMIINARRVAGGGAVGGGAAGGGAVGGGGGWVGGAAIGGGGTVGAVGDWHYFPIYTIEVHTKKLVQSNMHVNHLVNSLKNDLQRCSGRSVFEGLKLRENVKVKLCVGAQVMLNYNLSVSAGLANGVKGVVMTFDQAGNPWVQFDGFATPMIVLPVNHLHFTEFYKLTITQYPLDLAWATTIHKSQGLSLSKIITNLSNVFSPGQSYVCLSRVKSLDGLYLMGIDYNKIKCNQTAKKFYYDLKYYCEFQYMGDCRDLMSTSSWLKHPNICDRCMSYFLTVWVNDLPFELNMMIVEYLEKF